MRVLAFLFTVSFVLSICSSALLENTDKQARKELKQAKKLFKKREFAEAASAFRRANEIKPSWKILFNIGQSEAAAKRHGLALQAFEAYLSQGGDDVPKNRLDTVLSEVERLRKMVGMIEIVAPENTNITIDGLERGKAPFSGRLPVAASINHKVVGTLDGETVIDREIQVMGEQQIIVRYPEILVQATATTQDVEDESPDSDAAISPEEQPASTMKTWGWVTVGIGGALLIGGAVTGGLALSKNGELNDECDPSCGSSYQDDVDTRDGLAMATNVLLIAGGVAAVAGVLMLTVFDKAGESDSDDSAAPPPVALTPMLGPQTAGATLEWRF
jgi:hypothetical protein